MPIIHKITSQTIQNIMNINPNTKLGLMFPFIWAELKDITFSDCVSREFPRDIEFSYKNEWVINFNSFRNIIFIRTIEMPLIFDDDDDHKQMTIENFIYSLSIGKEDLV